MKRVMAVFISLIPINLLRIIMYNMCMGYQISLSSRIGIGTVISLRKVSIKNAQIGMFNRFVGGFDLVIGDNTSIGSLNEFTCTSGSRGKAFCEINDHVHITNNHFFDASGGLKIKDYTRIAGRCSQFWTHGGQRKTTSITIGERCYIGSSVKVAQGVDVPANCYVGLGSVVVESFNEPNVMVMGNPAKIVKYDIVARKSLEQ